MYPSIKKLIKRERFMSQTPYISDILSQPAALREALNQYPADQIGQLAKRIQQGEFKRIVLTGMGSSNNGAYPAWLKLLSLSIPTIYVNTAELLHYGQDGIDSQTLLWINSQSGYSAEIVRLLEQLKSRRPAFQLSMCNDPESPLAKSADLNVSIYAGNEATVSTKTYLNMLAMLLLGALQLSGADWQKAHQSMLAACSVMEAYLADWQVKVKSLDYLLGEVDQMLLLGRGPSMAAVWNGSLIIKEASKCTFEGMNVADFRHGPMELASSKLTIMIFEGAAETVKLNHDLALEVLQHGGKVIWVAKQTDSVLPTMLLPQVDEVANPLIEILPIQLLTLVLADRNGIEAGKFRHIGKVTVHE
jgi:glutamine---fructose-6-phosphate transaminase (isomerizing)